MTDIKQYSDTTVIAEDAPIGIQLWPTTNPEAAKNFTLLSVEIITKKLRDASGTYEQTYVEWTYENLTTRLFDLGQAVAVRIEE